MKHFAFVSCFDFNNASSRYKNVKLSLLYFISSYSVYCINATSNSQQIHFRTASVFKQLNYILCTKFVYISRKGNDLVRTWQCKSNIFSGNCQVSLYIADYTYDDVLQVGQFVRITNSIISLPWKILLLYFISSRHSYDDNYLPNSILKFKKKINDVV